VTVQIITGDALAELRKLLAESVHCCVTSPPYWNLRDYGVEGQLGLEPTMAEYIAKMVEVFGEVRRVLRADGTLWLDIGDAYNAGTRADRRTHRPGYGDGKHGYWNNPHISKRVQADDLKAKDMCGIPWRVAFALQADGWWLRSDIIWCLSGGTWAYARTQKGDMPIMVKDLVRLNPATVRLWNGQRWTRTLGWNRSADTAERTEIVLRSGERIGCTGTHLWPTQRGNVAARDLRRGDSIVTCALPEPDGAQAPAYLTLDLCWLAGLYLAEGSRSEDTMQLSLHADEERWLPRIRSAAAHLGASVACTVDGDNLAVRMYGRVLAASIDSIVGGRVALDKHIRAEAWRLPNTHIRAIIAGYLDGDGHHDRKNDRVRLCFARNYALERDLRTAAARLGATLTLTPVIATYQRGKRAAFRGEWRWARSGHRNEKERGEVIEIRRSRSRQFWDIEVEDDPHLFALASGVLTHNSKPNPMPESVTDRPTKAHEYVFLMAKAERYFYDAEAIAETAIHTDRVVAASGKAAKNAIGDHRETAAGFTKHDTEVGDTRNARSVWTVATQPFKGAHFATFPPALAERCIKAGCPAGGTVLDPFGGAGTTGLVADRLGRHAVLIELNPAYAAMARERINGDAPLFGAVHA
jgi:DNA modification methylase